MAWRCPADGDDDLKGPGEHHVRRPRELQPRHGRVCRRAAGEPPLVGELQEHDPLQPQRPALPDAVHVQIKILCLGQCRLADTPPGDVHKKHKDSEMIHIFVIRTFYIHIHYHHSQIINY